MLDASTTGKKFSAKCRISNLCWLLFMLLQGLAGHNDVILVDEDYGKFDQNPVHHPLEGILAFLRPNGRPRNSKRSKDC
jgi:hypothetical protein